MGDHKRKAALHQAKAIKTSLINFSDKLENIVNQVLADRLATGKSRCSTNTASYCEARKRLPESLVREMVLSTGKSCENSNMNCRKWHSREVKIADGTILSMPDTPENQERYSQSGNQKKDVVFL